MNVTIQDSRVICGKFMAFDKHMNLILGDAEEFRKVAGKGKLKEEKEEKRTLGLVLIRGECVVSLSVEGPPIEENKARVPPSVPGGPGVGRAAARGIAIASSGRPPGLAGPIRGVGGPSPSAMMPQPSGRPPTMSAPAMSYGGPPRGMPMMRPMSYPGPMPPGLPFRPGMPPTQLQRNPGGMFPPGMPPPGVRPPGIPPGGIRGIPPGPPMPGGMPPGQPMPRPPQ